MSLGVWSRNVRDAIPHALPLMTDRMPALQDSVQPQEGAGHESSLRSGSIPARLAVVFLDDGLWRPQPTQILNEPRDRGAVVCAESARSDRHESRGQSRLR